MWSVTVPSVPPPPRALSPQGRSAALADLLRQATQASLDPEAVLEVAVRWCARVLGDAAAVWTLARDGETLERGPATHRDPAREETETALDPGLSARARERQTAVADGGRMVAPLRSRGRVLGVLAVQRD
ncbi:MAG: hypothetical protein JWR63_4114, partial [Conexibacter sp.]|nr:hypothetical protein [Conexibacter sp.]